MNQDLDYLTKFSGESIIDKFKEGPLPVTAISAVGAGLLTYMIKASVYAVAPAAAAGGAIGYFIMKKSLKK